ncbi:MAG: putative lipid II flippase FtsW [Ruminococcus sp.]|nr:putative lipid II flippase FtsW [Ruminococcus sp.]
MANAAARPQRTAAKKTPQKTAKKRSDFWAVGKLDVPFLLLVITILTIGLVMLFSASYTYAYYNEGGDSAYFFKRQLVFAVAGVIAMFFVSKVRYDYFKLFAIPAVLLSWFLLVIVLFLPPVKPGFHRWINLGLFTFQPSEIAKLAIILFCAWHMDKNHKRIIGKHENPSKFSKTVKELSNGKIVVYDSFVMLCLYGMVIVLTAGLVYLENHLSGTILILAIGVVMLFLGEVKQHWFILIGILAVVAVVFFIFNPEILEKYAGERITAWLDKTYEPRGARWQTNNSLYAIGSGGLFGTGLGNSKQKHLYVSEPQNDFIFAIVCEELGFLRAVGIILLYVLLVARGVKIGLRAKDRFGALLAMGIVFQVGLQTALNIAVVTDALPNTGISLPFFSYGGTSLMMLLFEMGVVLSVSRYSRLEKN